MAVLGRDAELRQIADWLLPEPVNSPAAGTGGAVLVLEGQPGIGKTTLWAEAVRLAGQQGWRVLSCRPVPSNAGLPHVGLADLLRTVPGEAFRGLPPPQQRALGVALLREEAPDRDLDPRAVGIGLTALLGMLAQAGRLVLAVDDAQWLDPASAWALGFALRRVEDRHVRVLTVVRMEGPASPRPAFAAAGPGITRLEIGPLSVAAIHQVFRQALGTSFPRPVLVRIHRATAGNPFYALEIARELRRLGEPPPGRPLPVPDDHRELALLRLRRLPRATRDTLALVAAMPRPSADGLDLDVVAPAERAGIVRVRPDGRVEFAHPLFGSALYATLPEAARRRLHRDLAARAGGQEERARHLALAADGPDEATAAELDRAAVAASARGAAEVAVELKELACRLTPATDRAARAQRDIELADRRFFAGDPAGARKELERSLGSLAAGEDRARVLLELGSVLWAQGPWKEGMALISQAHGEASTPALRARIHSRISALADDVDVSVEHGEAALALLDERADPQLYSFALHNVALFRLYAGRGADHKAVETGTRLQREAAAWEMSTAPAYWARNLDDFATARGRFEDLVRAMRQHGDEATVSGLLTHLAVIEALTGYMDRARRYAAEALDLAGQTEQQTLVNMALSATGDVCARAGELGEARRVAGELLGRLDSYPDIVLEGRARAALGHAALTAGDLTEADKQFSRADAICESLHIREPAGDRFHADHAEAVIGLGDLDRARELVRRMEARAAALPRPWILAVSARSRGLLNAAAGQPGAAHADYERALAACRTLEVPSERGRTLLSLGRLYRRGNKRQRAAASFAEAAGVFRAAGAVAWAGIATDEQRRAQGKRGSRDRLTPTERRIAELAGAGQRNQEIAARLFVSPKTVEANLSRVYSKLGIRSRAELAHHLAVADGAETRRP
jgi:DNA-binding CsgD family transcriptional regulator